MTRQLFFGSVASFLLTFIASLALSAGKAEAESGLGRPGVVSHILVLSDKSEDVSSLEAWKKTYIKDGMSDQDKAMAIWRTVVRYRHQCPPPNEYFCPDKNVHDPLKMIHVYGYGMCCCASSNVDGLARYLGLKATCRGIGHMISEVWYDNGWHMVDGSLQQVFTKPDGQIASAEDIRRAVTQWLDRHPELRSPQSEGRKADQSRLDAFRQNEGWRKNGPELLASCKYFDVHGNGLGTHSWTSTMWYYDRKDVPEYETFPSMGYQLNVQLRAGEKLTRNWFNKGRVIDWTDADIMAGQARFALQRQLGDRARVESATAPGSMTCLSPTPFSNRGPFVRRMCSAPAQTGPSLPFTSRMPSRKAFSSSACPAATFTSAVA